MDIKLYYFNARGRAELVRLVLAAAGMKYEDVRFQGSEEWTSKYKPQAPFGQSPYLELDGKKFGQTVAMASFFAREAKLYGKTNLDALYIDQTLGLIQDLLSLRIKAFLEKDEAEKAKLSKKLQEEDYPRFMGFFEKFLADSETGYFVGKSVTLADIAVFDILDMFVKKNPDVLKKFPLLTQNKKNVESLDGIAAYLKTRPVTDM